MKTESLRVGNYYLYQNHDIKLDLSDFKIEHDVLGLLKPIPLTEEWLIKFNLEKRVVLTAIDPYNEYSIRNDFDIYCYIDYAGNCLIYGECIIGEDFFIIKCDEVHEFQDIFKSLTGEELNQI